MNKEIINQMKKRIVILGAGESGAGAALRSKSILPWAVTMDFT